MSLKNLGPVGPIYAHLGLLYLHLPINSILPGSSCGPLSGPTDLACAQLAIFCHLPTNSAVLWGCVKSQENRFEYWLYGLQDAIANRETGFLHSPQIALTYPSSPCGPLSGPTDLLLRAPRLAVRNWARSCQMPRSRYLQKFTTSPQMHHLSCMLASTAYREAGATMH